MGLKERTDNNTAYLLVKHHSLILESKEPREGYEPIEVTNPKTNEQIIKFIKRYAAVDGLIKKIEWYDTKDSYQTRFMGIKIHIADAGEYFQLDLPFNSRPYDSFSKLAENIDYSKPVEFSVWHDRKQDTTAFAVRQDGVPVKWKYTREDMGECPQPTQDKFDKWDFSKQREWLYGRLMEVVIPHVEALNAFDEPEPEYSGVEEPTDLKAVITADKAKAASASAAPIPPDDDIPF
jgi:hypothetical protein